MGKYMSRAELYNLNFSGIEVERKLYNLNKQCTCRRQCSAKPEPGRVPVQLAVCCTKTYL